MAQGNAGYVRRLVGPVVLAALAFGNPVVAVADAPVSTVATGPAAADLHAVARATAIRTGRTVPMDALTTATSTTAANPDGSFTTSTSALPTRVRSASGSWAAIDPTLRRNPDGSVSPVAVPSSLTLSGGGSGPVVSLSDGSGHSLGLSLAVGLPSPTLSGASATYHGVFRGIDLVVTVRSSGGFGEVFVVHDAAAAAAVRTIRFTTALRDLTLDTDPTGGLRAVDSATGAVVAVAPPASMWDSDQAEGAGDPTRPAASSPSGPGRGAHAARLPVAVNPSGLTLAGDPARLGGTGVTYPVYLDPTWTLPHQSGGTLQYTETQSGCPTAANYTDSEPGVGYNDYESCIGKFRSFFQIYTGNLLDSRYIIRTSTMKINEVFSAWNDCGQGTETITLSTTAGIDHSTNWGNMPLPGDTISSRALKSVGNSSGAMCAGGTVAADFDMAPGLTKVRANGVTGWTIVMVGNETPNSHSLERFNNNPSVLTVYDIRPDVPSGLAALPTPVTVAGATQPCTGSATGYLGVSNFGGQHVATLSAKLTSAAPSAQMQGVFTLHDDTTAATVGTYTSAGFATTGATVSVQTPVLTDGHTYSWSAQSTDQYYSSASTTPSCVFTVDQSAPTNPVASSTDYPPSGSATVTPKRYGQSGNDSGTVTLTAADPNPPGGSGAGMRGFYYSLDTPLPATGATLHPATSGSLAVTVKPTHWGTSVLYVQAVDNAGNFSGQTAYDFYEPWYPGAVVVPGDLTADGIPDLTSTTPAGALVEYPGNTDPATAPVTLSTSTYSPDRQGTPWNSYLVTHRGSFTNQAVDDLWAYDKVNHHFYLYKNFGSNPFQNTANTQDITKDRIVTLDGGGCVPTASTGTCADYDSTGWSTLTQVLGVGDFYAGSSLDVPGTNDLLTVEGGHLWLYRGQNTNQYLNLTVELGSTGWSGVTLVAPGLVGGKPTLWARDNATGVITSYTITFDAAGYPVGLGAAGSGSTSLSVPGATALTQTLYPGVASPGDLHGTGHPDLVVTTTSGNLIDYPGTAPSTAGVATFGDPVPLGKPSGAAHDWPLHDGSGSTATDTAGGTSAAFTGTVSWPSDTTRGTVAAFDGADTMLTLPQTMISGGSTLTLSLSFQATAGTSGILFSTGHSAPAALNGGAMPVLYIGTDGRLYGQYWTGVINPIISGSPVNDGAWHTATLVGDGNTQTLYLDGRPIRTEAGSIANVDPLNFAGAGVFSTSPWRKAPGSAGTTRTSYFTGRMSGIVFYASAQSASQLGATIDQTGFKSDGTIYPSLSTWYSAKTTMTFNQGLLSLTDASTGALLATRGTTGYPFAVLNLQADGNLVIYADSSLSKALWASGTGSAGDSMTLQTDGNLVIHNSSGASIWATGTNH